MTPAQPLPPMENAGLILFLMVLAPVVIWGLWASYFQQYIQALEKTVPEYDAFRELRRIRTSAIGAYLLETLVYLLTAPIRVEMPVGSIFLFILALIAIGQIQNNLEMSVRKTPLPVQAQVERIQQSIRATLWIALGFTAYAIVIVASNLAAILLGKGLGLDPGQMTALVVSANLVGISVGLGLTFVMAPWVLKQILVSRELEAGEARNLILSCFSRAGISPGAIRLIGKDQSAAGNAMIAGFRSKSSSTLKPTLFVTQTLIEGCTRAELEAVILHEISHVHLGHLKRRLTLSVAAVFGSTVTSVGIGVGLYFILPFAAVQAICLLLPILSFAGALKLIKKQIHRQELEADRAAVVSFGASPESLGQALRKLDTINGQTPGDAGSGGHPSTDERVAAIQAIADGLEFRQELSDELDRAA